MKEKVEFYDFLNLLFCVYEGMNRIYEVMPESGEIREE